VQLCNIHHPSFFSFLIRAGLLKLDKALGLPRTHEVQAPHCQ
jgi:hypothetical protein